MGASADPVAAAKVLVDFAKSNDKLTIVGGSLDGKVLDKAGVTSLASMPSLDELRAKLVGLLNAPATKLARVSQAPASQLARVIKARADQLQ
jgi:large subunit ribosomal protein L10